jgi:polyhydroxyalkanoate synthesis regulator phasin
VPFQIVSEPFNRALKRSYVTQVSVQRRLYEHSTATIVVDWDDEQREGQKRSPLPPTLEIGAVLINTDILIRWASPDLSSSVDCFRGYVTSVKTHQTTTRSYIVLECIAHTKKTDLIPRYRVWQACTLADVCRHIRRREPMIQILANASRALSSIPINLTFQYGETDFSYLQRMLRAWAIPLATDDLNNRVVIGTVRRSPKAFPKHDWHWKDVSFESDLVPALPQQRIAAGGAFSIAKQRGSEFVNRLNPITANYIPQLDPLNEAELRTISQNLEDNTFHSATILNLEWAGHVYDVRPGMIFPFGGMRLYVRAVSIEGHPSEDTVTQTIVLQDRLQPTPPPMDELYWRSRVVLGRVVKNNHEDPTQSGRVQVEFDWEKLDPTSKGANRAWLPVVTPYAAVAGGRAAGFLSLPEVGEHVLVQFLGDWDSQAVVVGVVRDAPCTAFPYDPHETKRWQTPSGNQVTMTTTAGGKTDIVRIKCRDKLVMEAKLEPSTETLILDLFDSPKDLLRFQKKGGDARLDILCSGDIFMYAEKKMVLQAAEMQLRTHKGNIQFHAQRSIKGLARTIQFRGQRKIYMDAPIMRLNCGQPSIKEILLDAFSDALKDLLKYIIVEVLKPILEKAAKKLEEVIDKVGKTVDKAVKKVGEVVDKAAKAVDKISKSIGEKMSKFGEKIGKYLSDKWNKLKSKIADFSKRAINKANRLIDKFVDRVAKRVPKSMRKLPLKAFRKVAAPITAVYDIYQIVTAPPEKRGEAVGSAAGCWGGAAIGAAIGSKLLPGVGTVVGAGIGCMVGSAIGGQIGSWFDTAPSPQPAGGGGGTSW